MLPQLAGDEVSPMKELNFTSCLKADIESFIAHKNSLGFPYEASARILLLFDRMCSEHFPDHDCLGQEIALAWAERKPDEHPNTLIRRISPIRGLAEYMNRTGKPAFVIPKGLPNHEVKYIPYIYTREEIASLIAAADKLTPQKGRSIKHLVIPCALRLLYATGMRHGEARLLKAEDVDLDNRVISIGESKNSLGRIVPIGDEICGFLEAFDQTVSAVIPGRTYFFSRHDGGCYSKAWLQPTFLSLKYLAGIEDGTTVKRVHDIRHSYCVHRLNDWAREGADIQVKLAYLSAYIGHVSIESTDYYLHLVPDFFPEFSTLVFERNGLLPEVVE